MADDDRDDGFGPYLCLTTKRLCNPARDHCRCWWLSESPDHWRRLAAIKIASANEQITSEDDALEQAANSGAGHLGIRRRNKD